MARKSKYTPETRKRILEAIQLGATYELAANYAGIHYDTFRTWMHDNSAFSDAIKEAEGKAVMLWLAKIERAASEGNWQAAAWKLERRYPDLYGRSNIQLSAPNSLGITVVLERMRHDRNLTEQAAAFVGLVDAPREVEG